MPKIILITGATDGIGRETARRLSADGHHLLLHGRSVPKLAATAEELRNRYGAKSVETYQADFSALDQVARLGLILREKHHCIDVLINNAGVFKTVHAAASDGVDLRFVVNAFAPALLAQLLLPILPADGRVVNLSSAAQASVEFAAPGAKRRLKAMDAYAQSKLALTMWSQAFAKERPNGPVSVAVNPGSLLATKMVRKGFGVAGNDIGIGADILVQAALSDEFADATGRYFDNDVGAFTSPHPDAADPSKVGRVVGMVEDRIAEYLREPLHACLRPADTAVTRDAFEESGRAGFYGALAS